MSRRHVVAKEQVRPALEATFDQIVQRYNQQARAARSLNATVEIVPVAGSSYSGVIEEYHDVQGFILAKTPALIRVIGQAPVVAKNVFDMVSDGETFRVYIPSKNKFIVGPAAFEHASAKPIENLRPQHLMDALFWPEALSRDGILFEEANLDPFRYYILTFLRGSDRLEIARKAWFDRADLDLVRVQFYASGGRLISDIRYSEWQEATVASLGGGDSQSTAQTVPRFPRHIWLARPRDNYQLEIRILRLVLNESISADRFKLEQPVGTELVRVGEKESGTQP